MKIFEFPELRQTYNFDCGAKAIQAVLAYYGFDMREEKIMKMAKTVRIGTPIDGILFVLKEYRFKYKSGKMTILDLKKYIDKKIPIILLLQAWSYKKKKDWKNDWKDGHFVVAIGYDKEKIYFEDPSSVKRTYLTFSELKERWHDEDTDGKRYFNFGIAVFGEKSNYKSERFIHMK